MSDDGVPILVVDDEAAIRRLLRTSLSAQGFAVSEATTGAEGLAAVRRDRPDLVVLDLGLPDMDGLEVIRRLRAAQDRVPIIVLSSRDDETGKVQALEEGADDYVTKPSASANWWRACAPPSATASTNRAPSRCSAMAASAST